MEVERFYGKGDFGIWRRRIAALVQQKVAKALGSLKCIPESLSDSEKSDVMEMAFSTFTLHLDDKVMRKVSSESTAAGLWKKLEDLYLNKSLQDRIYRKSKFFEFKMHESKSIRDSLDEYNRLTLDLDDIGIKIDDEDKAIILLNSLPKSFSNLLKH